MTKEKELRQVAIDCLAKALKSDTPAPPHIVQAAAAILLTPSQAPAPEAQDGDSLMIHVPDATRGDLIAALATMPDEAFGWFVLACPRSAMTKGGNAQIWPDGMGGFTSESRASVEAVRQAADAYVSQK